VDEKIGNVIMIPAASAEIEEGIFDIGFSAQTITEYHALNSEDGIFRTTSDWSNADGAVKWVSGYNIRVLPFSAIVNGSGIFSREAINLYVDEAETEDRFDYVVIRRDMLQRRADVVILKGKNGQFPQLSKENLGIYDFLLAQIRIRSGTLNISQTDIFDRRVEFMTPDKIRQELIRVSGTTRFAANSTNIDPATGQPDVLYLLTEPTLVIKQLPTFASAAEATAGKDGITISPSGAYSIIGRNTALSNGYSVPLATRYYSIMTTFSKPVKATAFTVMQGGVSGTSWASYLASLEVSTDGTNWTYIMSSLPNADHINETLNLNQEYLAYRFNIAAASAATGALPHALGALNLFFEEMAEVTGTTVAFKVSEEESIKATSAGGRTFTHSFLIPIDLKDMANGTYKIAVTPQETEIIGNVLPPSPVHPKYPSEGDIYYNWMLQDAFRYIDGEWQGGYEGAPVGSATMQDGLITTVETFPLNQNGYNVNTQTEVAIGAPLARSINESGAPDFALAASKAWSAPHIASTEGYIRWYVTASSSSVGTMYIAGLAFSTQTSTSVAIGLHSMVRIGKGQAYQGSGGTSGSITFIPLKGEA